ncbi:MAG: VWA domain-containing protein, partial [Pyrinomonadaceae bacterium]
VDTSLVNIPVIVSDRDNRYIPGLTKEDFRLFKDGSEQKIDVFSNEQAPMNIVLALDTSLSTTGVLGNIKKAAKEFVSDLDTTDRCMIVSFDFSVHELSPLTSDKDKLDSAIKQTRISKVPGTVLNDAVYHVVATTLKPIKGRKAIILLTDGKDFGSDYRQTDLLDRLAESDTVIYPIYYDTEQRTAVRSRPFPGGMGRFPGGMGRSRGNRSGQNHTQGNENAAAFLQKLADITGGRFFKAKRSEMKDAFVQIADEMKRQYLVGFYPSDDALAGTIHKVKVQVNRPDAAVRAKSEYRTQAK